MLIKKIMIGILIAVVTVGAVFGVIKVKNTANDTNVVTNKIEEPTQSTQKFTAKPGKVTKSETVYVTLDAAGGINGITVSDKITTDIPNCAVNDKTSLTEITPISSPVASENTDKGITWHMDSTEFIYNGKSDKKLPVSIDITYFLNGKQISAHELYGKAGKVTVKIKLTNNEKRTLEIQGLKSSVYSPFAVAGGMILAGGKYSDVTVDNGKVISDQSKDLVVTVGFPGLNESLNLDSLGIQDLKFPDEFTINMTTSSFDAGNFYFAVIPLSIIDADFVLPDSLSSAIDGLDTLSDIQTKLSSIDIDSLMKIFSSETGNNISDLLSSVDGTISLLQSNKALLDVLSVYATEENITKLKSFITSVQKADLQNNTALVNSAASLLGVGDLLNEYKAIAPLLTEIGTALDEPEVQTAIDNLPQTIEQIKALSEKLEENSDTISQFAEFLNSDSFDTLLSLMSTYSENKDLFASLTVSSEELSQIVPYLEKWFNLAKDYKIYTSAAEGTQTEVMFIYKTKAAVK